MSKVLIEGGCVWDGATLRRRADVLVEGGRVAAVAERGQRLARDGAHVVDAAGATLIPGLVEAHGHLSFPGPELRTTSEDLPPEETTLVTMHNARRMLDAGFTGVICAGSPKLRAEVVIRNEIEAGRIPGPRMLASTPTLTATGGLNDTGQLHQSRDVAAMVVDGPDAIRRAVRLGFREGVDVVKINISGDDFFPRPTGRTTTFTEAEVRAAAETASELGLLVSCHARSAESVKRAVRSGITLINHADFADEEALDMLEAAKDSVFVAPSIGYLHSLLHDAGAFGIAGPVLERMGVQDCLEHNVAVHTELRKRGVRAVIGGDYGLPWQPNGSNARDIGHFVDYLGYTPADALRCATLNGARLMGEQGLIKPDARADLLLVDGDPTLDPSLLVDAAKLLMIMKGGEMHKAPEAQRTAAAAAAA